MRRSGGKTFHRRWLRQRHEETLWDAIRAERPADPYDRDLLRTFAALEAAVPAELRARLDALVGTVCRLRRPLERVDGRSYPAGMLWRVEARHADRLACTAVGDQDLVLVLLRIEVLALAHTPPGRRKGAITKLQLADGAAAGPA